MVFLTTLPECANKILGINFIRIEDVIECLQLQPSIHERLRMSDVPYSRAVLEANASTHLLIPVFRVSICELKTRFPELFFCGLEIACLQNADFVHEEGTAGWRLVRIGFQPDTEHKTFKEQMNTLAENEQVVSTRLLIYTLLVYRLIRGTYLFEGMYARTANLATSGAHVCVSFMGSRGIDLADWDDIHVSSAIGLSTYVRPTW